MRQIREGRMGTNTELASSRYHEREGREIEKLARNFFLDLIENLKNGKVKEAVEVFKSIDNIKQKEIAIIVMQIVLTQCHIPRTGKDPYSRHINNIDLYVGDYINGARKKIFLRELREKYTYYLKLRRGK